MTDPKPSYRSFADVLTSPMHARSPQEQACMTVAAEAPRTVGGAVETGVRRDEGVAVSRRAYTACMTKPKPPGP